MISIIYKMEELHMINGHRSPEIHTLLIWNGNENCININKLLSKLPVKDIELVKGYKLKLSKQQQINLCSSIYNHRQNRVQHNSVYLVIIKDLNPQYTVERSWELNMVLNKKMKIIKEYIRLKLGGSKRSFWACHSSYNPEEVLLVLKPLNLLHLIQRPTFPDFKSFFDHLNKHDKLKYTILRSVNNINQNTKTDIHILVNDYYYFKSITGARSCDEDLMRENNNGPNTRSKIMIGKEVIFNIRFIGDNYIDPRWESDLLNRRIKYETCDTTVYIPNSKDEMYSLIYHILIQKKNPSKSKHIQRVQELRTLNNLDKLDFNNIKEIRA